MDQELIELLRARSLRVTSQRLLIHRALKELDGHVSAEDVHEDVSARLPGVTQQTVYSTLQLLAELGVARRVIVASGPARFETRLDEHHHMDCRGCGSVSDLEVGVELERPLTSARSQGFAPESAMVTIVGLCPGCQLTHAGSVSHLSGA